MARVIVSDAAPFGYQRRPSSDIGFQDRQPYKERVAKEAALAALEARKVDLADQYLKSQAVDAAADPLRSVLDDTQSKRDAALEAIVSKAKARLAPRTPAVAPAAPAAREMPTMPKAGEGPLSITGEDVAVPATGTTSKSIPAMREDIGDAEARMRFEAARRSMEESADDDYGRAVRSLMPGPAEPPVPAPVSRGDKFTKLGTPSRNRIKMRYTDYTDRDLADQLAEIGEMMLRGETLDAKTATAAEKLRYHIDKRGGDRKALIEEYVDARLKAAESAPAPTPTYSPTATGPTNPGAKDETTGPRAADFTRGGVTVKGYGRMEQEALTPGAQQSEEALRASVPDAKAAREESLAADLAPDGPLGRLFAAANRTIDEDDKEFDYVLASLGPRPSAEKIVSLSRIATTPQQRQIVEELALNSAAASPTSFAERRDPSIAMRRAQSLLQFPAGQKKSSLEIYSDVLKDAGSYIRSRYGNDPEMFKALTQAMYQAGIIDVRQAQAATKEFEAANKAEADKAKATKPPSPGMSISVSSTTGGTMAPPQALTEAQQQAYKSESQAAGAVDKAEKDLADAKAAAAANLIPSLKAGLDAAVKQRETALAQAKQKLTAAKAASEVAANAARERQEKGGFTYSTTRKGAPAVSPIERKQQIKDEIEMLRGEVGATKAEREAFRRSNPKRYDQIMAQRKKLDAELARLP